MSKEDGRSDPRKLDYLDQHRARTYLGGRKRVEGKYLYIDFLEGDHQFLGTATSDDVDLDQLLAAESVIEGLFVARFDGRPFRGDLQAMIDRGYPPELLDPVATAIAAQAGAAYVLPVAPLNQINGNLPEFFHQAVVQWGDGVKSFAREYLEGFPSAGESLGKVDAVVDCAIKHKLPPAMMLVQPSRTWSELKGFNVGSETHMNTVMNILGVMSLLSEFHPEKKVRAIAARLIERLQKDSLVNDWSPDVIVLSDVSVGVDIESWNLDYASAARHQIALRLLEQTRGGRKEPIRKPRAKNQAAMHKLHIDGVETEVVNESDTPAPVEAHDHVAPHLAMVTKKYEQVKNLRQVALYWLSGGSPTFVSLEIDKMRQKEVVNGVRAEPNDDIDRWLLKKAKDGLIVNFIVPAVNQVKVEVGNNTVVRDEMEVVNCVVLFPNPETIGVTRDDIESVGRARMIR